jgi:hypothetical protein
VSQHSPTVFRASRHALGHKNSKNDSLDGNSQNLPTMRAVRLVLLAVLLPLITGGTDELHDGDVKADTFLRGFICSALLEREFFLFPRMNCTCNIQPVRRISEWRCTANETVCVVGGRACSVPELYGRIDPRLFPGSGSLLYYELCYANVVVLDRPLAVTQLRPFCINIGREGRRFQPSSGENCTAGIGDVQCNSCELCDDGFGVNFNCSNIDSRLVASQCSRIDVLNGELQGQFPELDYGAD